MTSAILIDVVLLAVLLLFIALGAHRGFILTLFSLAAVIVALVGANLAADILAPKLAASIEPKLAQSIQETLEERILTASTEDEPSVVDVLAALKEKGGFYQWAADQLEDTLHSGITETASQAAAAAAAMVAQQLAHGLIFLIGFFAVLLIWTLLSHALDLVARLPGLSSLNRTAGGILGCLKGIIVLYLAAWILCDLTGFISSETASQTHLLSLLVQHSPLELFALL